MKAIKIHNERPFKQMGAVPEKQFFLFFGLISIVFQVNQTITGDSYGISIQIRFLGFLVTEARQLLQMFGGACHRIPRLIGKKKK